MNDDDGGLNEPIPSHSCNCLNVRVTASEPGSGSNEPNRLENSSEYTTVFVTVDGVFVAHPQLVLRTRTKGVPIPGSTRNARYTSLTCLVCHSPVYRVYQVVPVNVEGREGPVVPNETSSEGDILKSTDGWIEVHKGCITGAEVARRLVSPHYSPTFLVVFPPQLPPSEILHERSQSPSPSSQRYLSYMAPALPPPPFTPTSSIFKHIASVALTHSSELRHKAERELAEVVKAKAQEIEAAETILRQQVEVLWRNFREGIGKAEHDRNTVASKSLSVRNWDKAPTPNDSGSSPPRSPLAVRSFVPLGIPPIRSPPQAVRVSTLSASLATSSFHHPAELDGRDSPLRDASPHEPVSPGSLQSSSSITIAPRPPLNGESTLLQLSRIPNENINTAASYQVFLNIEEEMNRKKRENALKLPETEARPTTSLNGDKQSETDTPGPSGSRNGVSTVSQSSGAFSPKAKQRVKFLPVASAEDITKSPLDEELVFDLESEVGASRVTSTEQIEHPVTIHASKRAAQKVDHTTDSQPSSSIIAPQFTTTTSGPMIGPTQDEMENEEQPMSDREAEIRRLLAADTPSHRGAWRVGGPAWKNFLAGKSGALPNVDPSDVGLGQVDEEDDIKDDGDSQITQAGVAASMPITITMPYRPKEAPLSLASYQPQPVLTQPPESQPRLSRWSKYTERDQNRALDPGVLDFSLAEEDEDEVQVAVKSADITRSLDEGDRGREHALKIIQARIAIPEAGMWRSMA